MANLLWGKVYFHNTFVGHLRTEPGEGTSFTYDQSYLSSATAPIAHTLPLQAEPHINLVGLLPYFDNLVSEGWLAEAQTRLLGRRTVSRFELLLAFGHDCAGAVSVLDPEPSLLTKDLLDSDNPRELATLTSRASLSGVQPKLALVEREGRFVPSKFKELSTFIAKFPSAGHLDLVHNEYLTTQAFKALLPDDDVVDLSISEVTGIAGEALIIKRFDRDKNGRVHFEEFNQLLGRSSDAKYSASYAELADFIRGTPGCIPTEIFRIFARILAGFLLGNTDMHLKNFAMYHTPAGLRLTPSYDQVCAALYDYNSIALKISGGKDLLIGNLKAKNLMKLSAEFGLPVAALDMILKQLGARKEAAAEAIHRGLPGHTILKDKLIKFMDKRWNGTFALTGRNLSKKRNSAGRDNI